MNLAIPIIGVNVLFMISLAADTAMCGRLPDAQHALAALGFATQLVFLLMVLMLGLAIGAIALTARAYGAGDTARLNHLLVQSSMLTAILGIVVGALGAVFARPLMSIMGGLGASDAVVDAGVAFLRPLMLATPFLYLNILFSGILRGVGNTRIPFLCSLVTTTINIGFNYVFILGRFGMPSLGVAGAALGSLIAFAINTVLLVAVLRRGKIPNLHLPLRLEPIDRRLALELYRIGWPGAVDMFVLNAGFFAAIGMLFYLGEVTVAAHNVGLRIQSLAFVPGIGISQATGALVGQALGSGNIDRARRITRSSIALCTGMMTVLGLLIAVFAHPIARVFDVQPGTAFETYTMEWMKVLAAWMIPAGFHVALMGMLQGAGATRLSLRINIYTTLPLQIPLAWLLAFPLGLGALGVWLSFPLSFVVKALWEYVIFQQGRWAVTGVRVHPPAPVVTEG